MIKECKHLEDKGQVELCRSTYTRRIGRSSTSTLATLTLPSVIASLLSSRTRGVSSGTPDPCPARRPSGKLACRAFGSNRFSNGSRAQRDWLATETNFVEVVDIQASLDEFGGVLMAAGVAAEFCGLVLAHLGYVDDYSWLVCSGKCSSGDMFWLEM